MIKWFLRLLLIVPLIVVLTLWIAVTNFGPKIVKRLGLFAGLEIETEKVTLGLDGLKLSKVSVRYLQFATVLPIDEIVLSPGLRPRVGMLVNSKLLKGTASALLAVPTSRDSFEVRNVVWSGISFAEMPELVSLGISSGSTHGAVKKYAATSRTASIEQPEVVLDQVQLKTAPVLQLLKFAGIRTRVGLPADVTLSLTASSDEKSAIPGLVFALTEPALGHVDGRCDLPGVSVCNFDFALSPDGSRVASQMSGVRFPSKGKAQYDKGRVKILP